MQRLVTSNSILTVRVHNEFEDYPPPLGFWENRENTFPVISKVAQVYLEMSSSSVPVEHRRQPRRGCRGPTYPYQYFGWWGHQWECPPPIFVVAM